MLYRITGWISGIRLKGRGGRRKTSVSMCCVIRLLLVCIVGLLLGPKNYVKSRVPCVVPLGVMVGVAMS